MKLSEIKGEKALDVLADIIEPATKIMADEKIKSAFAKDKIKAINILLKTHKKEVIKIMALLDGEEPKTYINKINILTLPTKLLEIVNDPEIITLFQ